MDDVSDPEFWNSRYLSGTTPWDFGGVPGDLKSYLRRRLKYPCPPRTDRGHVFIPGCGSGYEARIFADAGFKVTAIDIAPAAIERTSKLVEGMPQVTVINGDVFRHEFPEASFDVVYERTFLCAISPKLRKSYRDRVARLLKHGGQFVGYFYYEKTNPADGPPFGLAWGEGDRLFSLHFLLTRDDPVADSLPVFAGHERWQERRRTGHEA
ncbi:MAG TPA: methyltransferase domain-containing protein [Candidatus Didemnitutus sp.]|nr:methyltransferase domain-containing protein [Candidatus Didemnitutus sp.]